MGGPKECDLKHRLAVLANGCFPKGTERAKSPRGRRELCGPVQPVRLALGALLGCGGSVSLLPGAVQLED